MFVNLRNLPNHFCGNIYSYCIHWNLLHCALLSNNLALPHLARHRHCQPQSLLGRRPILSGRFLDVWLVGYSWAMLASWSESDVSPRKQEPTVFSAKRIGDPRFVDVCSQAKARNPDNPLPSELAHTSPVPMDQKRLGNEVVVSCPL